MLTSKSIDNKPDLWILHICHCHYTPFLDIARQYNCLFEGTKYKVLTVYLTGEASKDVEINTESNEVLFLEYQSHALKGLKLPIIRQLKNIFKTRQFAFCIAHRTKPTYLALLSTNVPVISVHHNYGDFDRWSRRVFFNFFKSRLLLIGVSDSVRDEIRERYPKWKPSHIERLYNHINVEKLKTNQLNKDEARAQLGINQEAWVIGSVARLHPNKDHATTIKAFHKALDNLSNNALLVIVGKGEEEQRLKKLVHALGITDKVKFTGNVNNASYYFKAFDLFVLASWREAFGMVLIEALCADIPVISSKNGGGSEVINGAGSVFTVGDVDNLAKIISNFHRDENTNNTASFDKLRLNYSDEAVRQYFWSLEFVTSIKS